MTTVQLLSRIARRGRTGDFTRLSIAEKVDLIQAANTGLNQVYGALPTYFKTLPEGFLLPAPQAITLAVTQYSNQLSSDVFTTTQFGRTVVLDGDPAWNMIIGTDRLLNPYMGETGTVNGTIYGDAVYSERYPFDRIVGNPRFANQQAGFLFGEGEIVPAFGGTLWPFEQNIGRPAIWWTQPLGNSQGNEPLLVLRFAPAPSQAYSVTVPIAYWAKRLTLNDYTTASTIPVPDQFLETALLPLAVRALMDTPIWVSRSKEDDVRVEEGATAALVFLRAQPAQQSPSNKIFCPIGF